MCHVCCCYRLGERNAREKLLALLSLSHATLPSAIIYVKAICYLFIFRQLPSLPSFLAAARDALVWLRVSGWVGDIGYE
jgi:hypothetical protein